jgi:hypothetical protein
MGNERIHGFDHVNKCAIKIRTSEWWFTSTVEDEIHWIDPCLWRAPIHADRQKDLIFRLSGADFTSHRSDPEHAQ